MSNNYDVLIIGAGPGGCSAAIELVRRGFSVAIIEKSRFPRHRIGESLPPKIFGALQILGVEQRILNLGFAPMTGTTVVQAGQLDSNGFDDSRTGLQVDRSRFDQALLSHAQQMGAMLHVGRPVSRLQIEPKSSTVWVDDEVFQGRWLVDASGSRSVVAQALKLKRKSRHRTLAICGYWRACRLPDEVPATHTLFEMLPEAWIWSLLRSDGLRNITIGIDPTATQFGAKQLQDFYTQVLKESLFVGPLAEEAKLETELMSYESTCFSSDKYLSDTYILVGDAASFIDPLTSQGVYKAMQSGIMAAAVINTSTHRPEAAKTALAYYQHAQEAFARNYAAITGSMYKASVYLDEPFWAQRVPVVEEGFLERLDRGSEFVQAVRRCGGDQIRLRADHERFAIEQRGRASRGWIVETSMLVSTDGQSLDLHDIELEVLVSLLDGRTMSEVFEGYVEQTNESRSNILGKSLRDALAKMIDYGFLNYDV